MGSNFGPRDSIKAVYKLIDQPTLVFIDDPRHALASEALLGLVAERAGMDLKSHKVVTEIVPASMIEELRFNTPDFSTWPVDRVGARVGARQVVYVLIDGFDPGGEAEAMRRPVAAARIKVVDVASGKRLFPQRGEQGVTTMLFFKQPSIEAPTRGGQAQLEHKLADQLGRDIANQFYDHAPREVGADRVD